MKIFFILAAVFGLVSQAYGLTCYTCSQEDYNGESSTVGNCYATVGSSGVNPTESVTCPTDGTGYEYYCHTQFTIKDGVETAVVRGCQSSDSDEDIFTTSAPSVNKCVTTELNTRRNPIDETNCYYHCTNDNCNNVTQSPLNPCSTNCGISIGGGRCNYITGTCVCNSRFTGSDCSTTTTVTTSSATRSCLQCNSLTDSGCSTSTISSACPSSQNYCSSANTTIYDSSDNVVRTVHTRGCTRTFVAVDECTFTNIYTDPPISDSTVGYNEFTCYSTCNTNGCNTNSADGVINGNEAVVLQCVQCSDTTGGGSCNGVTVRTPCSSATTHCKSTVTYMLSNRVDLSYAEVKSKYKSAYKLVSVVRECATAAVTSQCTSSKIGSLSLEKVTCTETCKDDGCNTGWPARPKCIRCSTDSTNYRDYGGGYDDCDQNPQEPADCPYPYQAYCGIQESGIEKDSAKAVAGYPHRVIRDCYHSNIGTGCSVSTPRSTEIVTCNLTCTTDGCNVGSGSSNGSGSSMPLQTIVALVTPVVIGWLAQHHL